MTDTTSALFERQERYIVVKRKHMTPFMEASIRNLLSALELTTVECAVVESDWPEYETVWRMIEDRTRSTPAAMPDGLVERVARAICVTGGNDPDVFLKSLGFCKWELYRSQAVAAIAAMPALDMIEQIMVAMNALLRAPKGVVPEITQPFYDAQIGSFTAVRAR